MKQYERIDRDTALKLAKEELARSNEIYPEESFHISYLVKGRFHDGSRKGWIISVKMNVPECFEPNIFFIEVSDPGGVVYIPPIL